jgi:hypothetical protein
MVNCFPEQTDKQRHHIIKRPGLALHNDDNPSSDTARGMYVWQGNLYAVWGNKVHKNGTALGGTLGLSTGRVFFDETGGATPTLLVQEPHATTARVTSINPSDTFVDLNAGDAQLPDDQEPGVLVLDQYAMVLDRSANVWNSSVGDETAWASTDFINVETRADLGARLMRHVNYACVLGDLTTEFLYDAANATGSPLSRLEGTVSLVGCPAPETGVQIDDDILFVAQSVQGGRFVARMKGFTPEPVSTKTVDEALDNEQENISNAYAYPVRIMGHSFYVLTLPTTSQKTWVYDLTEGLWSEWTYDDGTETYFIGYDSAIRNGDVVIQGRNNGLVYRLDPAVYQDYNGNDINVLFQTNPWDESEAEVRQGSAQNKFGSRLTFIGDKQASTANLSVSWSDDNYVTFNTARTMDVSKETPALTRLGVFRRRAFRGLYIANLQFRAEEFELNYRKGHYGV